MKLSLAVTILLILPSVSWSSPAVDGSSKQVVISESPYPTNLEVREVLNLGILREGVQLEIVADSTVRPSEAGMALFICQGQKARLMRGPEDLLGLVRITSDDEALMFTRLGTMYLDGFFGPMNGLEVLPLSRTGDFLRYGISSEQRKGRGTYSQPAGSGFVGILSDEAFRAGGFEEPKVMERYGVWTIERWVWQPYGPNPVVERIEGGVVQRIRETVGANGFYVRSIESSLPTPELPATDWRIPVLM